MLTIQNKTGRRLKVRLFGYAFAGRAGPPGPRGVWTPEGIWEHWWTQEGIRLAPRGAWSALLYEVRGEKVEVRDTRDRLLASLDLREHPLQGRWNMALVIHPSSDWQPFTRVYALGQSLDERFSRRRTVWWRTITPAELSRYKADFRLRFLPACILGRVGADALTREQMDGLREMVERGRTLVVCGGPDTTRLQGWERAGLLAVPVHGVRSVPGLRTLAQRYGVAPLPGPISVADVGPVSPPARVLLDESGMPLVIERPLGLGTLVLVTFDPTCRPFRGSAVERAFWQEWAGRDDGGITGISANLDNTKAFRKLQQELHLLPPSPSAVGALWLGYLLALCLVLALARRRVRWLVGISLGGSVAALALAVLWRSPHPVAAFSGLLYLRSGSSRGLWRGSAIFMVPGSGSVTLRVTDGIADVFDAPSLRLLQSPDITDEPRVWPWMPRRALVGALMGVRGAVVFQVHLQGDGLHVEAHNATPYFLKNLVALWGRHARLHMGDLPPGARTRRLLARVAEDGTFSGYQDAVPTVYGPPSVFGGPFDTYTPPLLLAHCPNGPHPELLADERPARSRGHVALVVAPSQFPVRGRFRLPSQAVWPRVVRMEGWSYLPRPAIARGRSLPLGSGGWAVVELRLPLGAGAARWDTLRLRAGSSAGAPLRLQLFDWQLKKWVPAGTVRTTQALLLDTPGRFVNRWTDALLARIENAGTYATAASVTVSGNGEAR